jgi:pilus assembly protein FimV
MPSSAEIAAISAAEATNEVRTQAEQFAGAVPAPTPAEPGLATAVETPLVDVASDMSSADNEVSVVDDSPKLEIVPPSENSAADSAYGEEDSVESGSASTSVAALQEELARKEEALITEQQTNEYLQERIKELESQVAGDDAGLTVEDEELAGMESRLREQRLDGAAAEEDAATPTEVPQITTSSVDEGKPWYSHWVTWLIAALVLVAGGFGWYRSRIASEGVEFDLDAANEDTVRGIKDEAEEILKVLDPDEHPESAETPGDGPASEEAAEQGDQPGDEDKVDSDSKPVQKAKAKQFDTEEAAVLDEDSADPEVRLDLARAYISMGDREAARAILGEVIEHGNESQRAEAQSMLDEM